MKLLIVGFILLLLLYSVQSFAQNEVSYSRKWCQLNGGVSEYVLSDRSRVDCVTQDYAIEVEWAHKWPESIGQSVYYSLLTNKMPGVVIIRRMPADQRFVERFELVADHLGIKYWYINLKDKGK